MRIEEPFGRLRSSKINFCEVFRNLGTLRDQSTNHARKIL